MAKIKKIPVEKAVGMHLAHDVTLIKPGVYKGPLFKKGHEIKPDDIEKLKEIGRFNVYVLEYFELDEDEVHEDDAAIQIANAAVGENIRKVGPDEAKINLFADVNGLLKINVDALAKINMVDGLKFVTKKTNIPVKKGEKVAIIGIGPLIMKKQEIDKAVEAAKAGFPVIRVIPFKKTKVGVIVTGQEVYEGKIQDKFGDLVAKKLAPYNIKISEKVILPDDRKAIRDKIIEFALEKKYDLILLSGGMAVDPDDVTPFAIRDTGARVVFHGLPVLPASSSMLAYLKDKIIFGISAGAIFYEKSVLDIFLPRFLARDEIIREEVAQLGHGGLLTTHHR
ncbi:MAG: molybdopterin-binding protein [Candidatus Odinarchaeota archaeon]|nr:molybdopterin-binding protein [Candidatus Odinarchaeota archaeon]